VSPRRWWGGPLDVEGLAADSVEAACAAVRAVSARRGLEVDVSTTDALVAASFAAMGHLRVDGRPAEAWAPYSGFFAASDGWVRLHGNYPHHAAAIEQALGVASKDELVRRAAGLPVDELERRMVEARGIATAVRTEQQWADHPHARATAGEPWHTVTPGAPRPRLGAADLPLAGVRVLDLTRVIAGPTCTQLLGCLGADVLRIDPPQRPELLDQYLSNGMGKRSVAVDLGRDAARVRSELLPLADVVVLGYRPGALARFGLDADAVAADHPTAVVAALSAWGEHGPWGDRPGFDSIVQAATGIAQVYARDGRPGALPVQALDYSTGYVVAADVMTLLAEDRGGVVRASLLGAARDLLSRPRPPVEPGVALEAPTATVGSPYGPLVTVPPPVLLDGRPLTRDVNGYAAGSLGWQER
jgi:crotonobetainyl-CoA:carnitine CoA-transferase CaiB-like acyl-CoA transferase